MSKLYKQTAADSIASEIKALKAQGKHDEAENLRCLANEMGLGFAD